MSWRERREPGSSTPDAGHGRQERLWVPGGAQTRPGSLTDPKSHTLDPGEGWQESGLGRGLSLGEICRVAGPRVWGLQSWTAQQQPRRHSSHRMGTEEQP